MTATTDTDENSEHKKDEFHDLLLENESVDAKKGEMAYDDVLEHLGEFGRYQKRIYFLLCLPAISCAFHKLVGVFIQARVPYRCKLSWEPSTSNYGFLRNNMSTYYPMDQLTHTFSGCRVIDLTSNSTSECDSWVYDRTNYESTTLTEWDLVCHKAWWKASADAIFMIGVLLGSIIFGALSDKYGRRIIFFISLILQACAGVLTGLAPNYFIFVFLRMIVGAATSGVFLVAYVLALEMVGPKKRMFAGVACQFFFTTGYIMTALFAYFLRNWRWLEIAISLPGLLFISYYWFIPESARWLLTKERKDEAEQILRSVAKENKVQIPPELLRNLLSRNEVVKPTGSGPEPTVIDLFRTPYLRAKTLVILFLWFVNSATYYGLSWNTGNLAGNEYVNFVLSGIVEYPAYTFLLLTLNRWGRKFVLCSSMIVAGLALISNLFIPAEMAWLGVTSAMIGKFAITASYGTVYIFTAEQFPTVIRNVGMGAGSTFARFGGILAPYVNILTEIYTPLPLIVFGLLSLSSVFFALWLPETLNKKLPDTIADGEKFGRKQKLADEMNDIPIDQRNRS
ncbi:LOW QUALITY PROTEIN: organic cation transporter protein [Nilaparvata lugens]|uniref:LOW QUALITY PROTEIN: organic cation transporter protein n=1 Tax=Nilaparvata lugens TaxID=108931 RepID=UPI00193D74A4|nr:LOW QUALITY PROTEIN: organic cation transporter protein [Nilaparvata lugens]